MGEVRFSSVDGGVDVFVEGGDEVESDVGWERHFDVDSVRSFDFVCWSDMMMELKGIEVRGIERMKKRTLGRYEKAFLYSTSIEENSCFLTLLRTDAAQMNPDPCHFPLASRYLRIPASCQSHDVGQ